MPGTPAPDDVPGHGDVAHARRLPRARRLRDARRRCSRRWRPQDVTKEVTASGPARPRRRRVLGRPQVGGRQAQRRPAALPVRQRRRGRARHVQGPLDPRARAAPAASKSMLIAVVRAAGAQRVRLHPRRVRPAVPPPRRRGRGGLRGRAISASASSAPTSPATSSSTAARARTSAARRRGCSPRSRASAAIRATARRGSPCKGLYQRPTVVNNVETLSNVAGIIAHGAAAFRKVGTPKSPGTQLVLDLRPHRAARRLRGRVRLSARRSSSTRTAAACSAAAKLKCIIPGGISTKVLTARGDRAASPTTTRRSTRPARRWARAA